MAAVSNGRSAMDPQSETQNVVVDRLKRLYPAVNEEKSPLPRAWSPKEKYNYIGLSQNNLRVHYKGKFLSRFGSGIERSVTQWTFLSAGEQSLCRGRSTPTRVSSTVHSCPRCKQRNQLILTRGELISPPFQEDGGAQGSSCAFTSTTFLPPLPLPFDQISKCHYYVWEILRTLRCFAIFVAVANVIALLIVFDISYYILDEFLTAWLLR